MSYKNYGDLCSASPLVHFGYAAQTDKAEADDKPRDGAYYCSYRSCGVPMKLTGLVCKSNPTHAGVDISGIKLICAVCGADTVVSTGAPILQISHGRTRVTVFARGETFVLEQGGLLDWPTT